MDLESIDPGKLDRKINLLYPSTSINETTNERIGSFILWAENIPAQLINESGGGEDIKGLQNVSQRNAVFIIRYREATAPKPKIPNATFQIRDQRFDEIYEVTRVEEMKNRRVGWIIYCKTKDNGRP